MAQTLRPRADYDTWGWLRNPEPPPPPEGENPPGFYTFVDETTPDDADYLTTDMWNSFGDPWFAQRLELYLTDLAADTPHAGWTIRARVRANESGCKLRADLAADGSGLTQTLSLVDIPAGVWTTLEIPIEEAHWNEDLRPHSGDLNKMQVRVQPAKPANNTTAVVDLSWLEVVAPDPEPFQGQEPPAHQILRPAADDDRADSFHARWTPEPNFSRINEASPSDAEYVSSYVYGSAFNGWQNIGALGLYLDPVDPATVQEGWIMRVRARRTGSGQARLIGWHLRFRSPDGFYTQFTVSDNSLTDLGPDWDTYEIATGAELSGVPDSYWVYAMRNGRLQAVLSSQREQNTDAAIDVAWMEIQTPNAGPPVEPGDMEATGTLRTTAVGLIGPPGSLSSHARSRYLDAAFGSQRAAALFPNPLYLGLAVATLVEHPPDPEGGHTARPAADVQQGDWEPPPIAAKLASETETDAVVAQPGAWTGAPTVVQLAPITRPGSVVTEGWRLVMRARYPGPAAEASAYIEIPTQGGGGIISASFLIPNDPAWATYNEGAYLEGWLTEAEAEALQLSLKAHEGVEVAWVELRTPDAAPTWEYEPVELDAASYARAEVPNTGTAWPAAVNGIKACRTRIEFPEAGEEWTADWWQLWDAPTGGNVIHEGPLNPVTVAVGDRPVVEPGRLLITAE